MPSINLANGELYYESNNSGAHVSGGCTGLLGSQRFFNFIKRNTAR